MKPSDVVWLPQEVRSALIAHARRDAPDECCGFLLGARRRIAHACPMANVDRAPARRFRIDPARHIAVRRLVRHLRPPLDIVGLYHSHPRGPSYPSEHDRRHAHYPDWIHVIVDLSGVRPRVRAYRIGSRMMVALTLRPPR